MEKELEVKNLRISFYTNRGMVKAIRDISFSINKGETLAIVGESGSGKSVTAKAMLGIEAPNALIEHGEILYGGQDLLKYSDEDFDRIRGNEITMIYQDPLSSLDPIMKIGKQMTEASLLNEKTSRKNAKKRFNKKIKELHNAMISAGIDRSHVKVELSEFKKFIDIGSGLKYSRDTSREFADSILFDIEQLETDFISANPKSMKETFKHFSSKLDKIYNNYVIREDDEKVKTLVNEIKAALKVYEDGSDTDQIRNLMNKLKPELESAIAKDGPNFFTLGYYLLKNKDFEYGNIEKSELNKKTRKYIDENFMNTFLADIKKAMEVSREHHKPAKKKTLKALSHFKKDLASKNWDISQCEDRAMKLADLTEKSVADLTLKKYSNVYTLRNVFKAQIKKAKLGGKEQLDEVKETLEKVLDDLENLFNTMLLDSDKPDFDALAVELVDYFKELSYEMVNRVSYEMAYTKAIRIMEEVGIKEPRKRFEQYSFEFSGGMRQRIVIAIAIAANPELLICDEPTTALDVTIQAQIIELINKLKKERNMSVLFITHDLGVVANVADRVAVMYAGKIVEVGTVNDIFYHPAHPYTWALLTSMPDLDTKEKLEAIPGTPPNMIYPPIGDAFADRNKYAMQIDYEKQPPMFKISETHSAATWLLHPNSIKMDPPKAVTDRIARMNAKKKEREEELNGK
jgi:oligopeptide/dipeptide ABC transporter ATP-binding protein